MDNLEYLNHISQSTQAAKRAKRTNSGILGNPIFKIAIVGVVGFFLLMAVGSMLGNLNQKSSTLTKQIYARANNLNSVITKYNPSVKSSKLRAIGSSLSTVLSNTTHQISEHVNKGKEKKDKKALELDKKTAEQETQTLNKLNDSLTEAKLNGILDRAYANQVGLQVSLLLSMLSQLYTRTKDQEFKTTLSEAYDSLETIHNNIESYSDAAS